MDAPRCGRNRTYRRLGALLAVAVLLVSAGAATAHLPGGSTSAALGDTTSDAPPAVVLVDNSNSKISTLAADNDLVAFPSDASAAVVGPMRDFDDDGRLEVPYVSSQQTLRVTDRVGEDRRVAPGNVPKSTTKLGAGDWDDDGTPAIFYVNASADDHLYRVEPGGDDGPTEVVGTGVTAVLGVADLTDDGTPELVYTGSSGELWYYNRSGDETNIAGTSIGSNSGGLGVGAPRDFDGDGTPRVPYVDTSGYLTLVNASGDTVKPNTGYNAGKHPVTGYDWTGDSRMEWIHLNGNDQVAYMNLAGSTGVTSADGNSVTAVQSAGVAGAAADPAPNVTSFVATNVESGIRVEVTTEERLRAVEVDISGSQDGTLTTSDFAESGSDPGPYTYTATFDTSTEGDYTASLDAAADRYGSDAATGQTASASIVDGSSDDTSDDSDGDTSDGSDGSSDDSDGSTDDTSDDSDGSDTDETSTATVTPDEETTDNPVRTDTPTETATATPAADDGTSTPTKTATASPTPTETTDGSGPGFGLLGALIALLGAAALARRR